VEAFLHYLLQEDTPDFRKRTLPIKLARAYHRDRWRVSPWRLGSRVDGIPLERPIFLLGTQGSGGTLIGRCLRRNADVVTVSGGWRHWTGTDELGIVRNRMERLPPALWGSSHRSDIKNDTFGSTHTSAFASDVLLPHYRSTVEDADAALAARFRRLLREHLAVFAPDPMHARFLDKTHAYTVKMPLIAALLEDARPLFVLVVRNPYGACTWAVDRKPPSFRLQPTYDERLELLATHWANAHRIALEDAEEVGDVAVVRFEDFLTDPEAVVQALCAFADLDYHPGMVPRPGQERPWATLPGDRKWYPLYADNRLERTTATQRAIIELCCDEVAARFGYRPDGRSPAPAPIEIVGQQAPGSAVPPGPSSWEAVPSAAVACRQ
jgi:hypothetical protein